MIKVVLVGCGYWGKNWYNTINTLPHAKTVAVIDPKPVIEVDTPVKSLLEFDRLELEYDVVVIATQAEYHKQYVDYFTPKVGKRRILVEKPCGLINEPRETFEECFPGYLFLSTPQYKIIKDIISIGWLGDVYYSDFRRASMGPRIRTDVSVVEDYMIHDLYMYANLFKYEDYEVQAILSTHLGNSIKPDTAYVTLKHFNHVSTFFSSWIYPTKERQITIVGSEGSVVWKGDSVFYHKTRYKPNDGKVDDLGNKNWMLLTGESREINIVEKRSALELEFEDFIMGIDRSHTQELLGLLLQKILVH